MKRKMKLEEHDLPGIIDSASDAIIVIDEPGFIRLFNSAAEKITGYQAKDAIGQEANLLIPDWLRLAADSGFRRAGASTELLVRTQKGGHVALDISISLAESGEKKYYTLVGRTSKKNQNQSQSPPQIDNYYRMLADHANDMISHHDIKGCYLYVSPACKRLLGYEPDEIVGRSAYDYIHPSDCGVISKLHKQALDLHDAYTATFRVRHKSGNYVWFETVFTTICDKERGDPQEIVAVSRDITARKAVEKALQQEKQKMQYYLDTIEAMVLVLDRDGRVTLANRKTCDVVGFPEEELLGMNWFATCLPDDEAHFCYENCFQRLLHGKAEGVEYVENHVIDKHGVRHLVAWHNGVIKNEYNEIVGTLSSGQDITELRRVQKIREQLEQQVIHVQKMEAIGLLTGGIAHDFNNILGSILGYTSLAMDRYIRDTDGKLADYLNEVLAAGERAKDLVAQLLAFSRGNSGERRDLNVAPLVKESLKMLRAMLPTTVEIQQTMDADLPAVLANPTQIQQVITNLCINARDAMNGKGRLCIGLRKAFVRSEQCAACCESLQGDYLELSVRDTGCGIGQDMLARIFEPFFTTKEEGMGTGMGLSMVDGIVHNHGGHILLKPASPGTEFKVFLPPAGDDSQ